MGGSGFMIIFLKAAIFPALYIKETSYTLEHSSMLDALAELVNKLTS